MENQEGGELSSQQDERQRDVSIDRNEEKRKRKKIRKMLEKTVSESLKKVGFQRSGNSYWKRQIGDELQLFYLQRALYKHAYYLEAGVCRAEDVPLGSEPSIVFCDYRRRKRINDIVRERYIELHPDESEAAEHAKTESNRVKQALDFGIPNGHEQYPGDYFFPSVNPDEASAKIELVGQIIDQYIPPWFAQQSSV